MSDYGIYNTDMDPHAEPGPTHRGAAAPPTLEALEEQLRTMQHRLGEFLFAEGGDERLDHPLLRSDVQALADAERALASLAAERDRYREALEEIVRDQPECPVGEWVEADLYREVCKSARRALAAAAPTPEVQDD